MSYFYRYIFSLAIAIALFYLSPPAQAQTLLKTPSASCFARLEIADYKGAIADCSTAISLANDPTELLLNRSIAYYRQGNYQAAIEDSDRIIALHKCDFRAYYNRALAYAGNKNYLKAVTDLNLALVQLPSKSHSLLADIYTDRGLAQFELANYQAAMQDFSLAIRLNPHDARAYYNRGCTCFRHGDYHNAIGNFTKALQLNPENTQAYANRGIARHELGYEQAAIQDLQQAAVGFNLKKDQLAYQKTVTSIEQIQQGLIAEFEIVDT